MARAAVLRSSRRGICYLRSREGPIASRAEGTGALPRCAFLLDVDNTLIDNDRVKVHLEGRIEHLVGPVAASRFWATYEQVRVEHDYVDLPLTLARFVAELPEERNYCLVASLILCYPYDASLYIGSLRTIETLREWGVVAILSDGDPVFQPAKIARSGLAQAVDGPVLIYRHKEKKLADVRRRVPAQKYVLVDDKPGILFAAKRVMGKDLVTVHVRQGKYSNSPDPRGGADIQVDSIAAVAQLDWDTVLSPNHSP